MEITTQKKSMSKHIMFSYQRNIEILVSKIFHYLKNVQSIPIWMDQHGGMNESLSISMADGIENCCVLVCFLTPEYQESVYCKKELMYAVQLCKPMVPCLVGSADKTTKWKPSQWLGFIITDLLYLNFTTINDDNFEDKCQGLLKKIQRTLETNQSTSCQQSTIIAENEEEEEEEEEESDDEDLKLTSSLILPPIIREDPQINDETTEIIPQKYSCEGDSVIRLLNQSSEIECNQDLYSINGYFSNSFTLCRFIFHNTSSQSISILQLSAEYENPSYGDKNNNKWIPCQITINPNDQIISIEPNKFVVYSITIKIQLEGSPGIDNQHRFRAHHLLSQPLRLKINIEDTQMKHASLIIEQVNRPLNLPTLTKLMEKLHISSSNILAFIWADDCSIEVRYFVLISYSNENDSFIKFSFGCDLSSLCSPTWDKQCVQTLQKTAKKEKKSQLIVHQNVFDSFIHCIALFDQNFKLQAIRITIKTNTSTTIQTIPLPIKQIFAEYQIF